VKQEFLTSSGHDKSQSLLLLLNDWLTNYNLSSLYLIPPWVA
jgi:hypothetical protein